jgi:mediator of RNA polymerase II transcription subunit 7
MMEDQLERSRAETRGIMEGKEKVERILEGLRDGKGGAGDTVMKDEEDRNLENGSDVWDELDREFG